MFPGELVLNVVRSQPYARRHRRTRANKLPLTVALWQACDGIPAVFAIARSTAGHACSSSDLSRILAWE
eukprot:6113172-Prorocentrum_lima.AAC.1